MAGAALALLLTFADPSYGATPGTETANEAIAISANPQSVGTGSTLTLDQVLTAAKERNPEIRSMRSMWEALKERPAQERALPNPMLTYQGMNEVGSYRFPNASENRFEVQQAFPFFGKRGLKGKVALADAKAKEFEYQTIVRDVIFMVKETYYDLYSVQRALTITRAQEDLLKQMESAALAKYKVGEVTQQDVLKAQAEISMLKTRILDLEQQDATLKATLNQLMNQPAESPLGLASTEPPKEFDLEAGDLLRAARENRPEINQAQAKIDRNVSYRALMKKEYWPDYRLGLEYRSFQESTDMMMFSLSVDLPLWRGKYKAGVQEATKMVESELLAKEAIERQSAADVQSAYFKLQSAQRTLDLYRTALIEQAEARFRASESGYRTGQIGFLDLLESERFLLDTRVMAAMAEGALGISWARLERAVGTDLTPGSAKSSQP